MNYPCPKCAAPARIEKSTIPENGTRTQCAECKTRFWVCRESFGGRALRKPGKIYCGKCGGGLDNSIACPACGTLYPDVVTVQLSRPVRRKTAGPGITFTLQKGRSRKARTKTATVQRKPGKTSPKTVKIAAGVAAVAILATAGGAFYYQKTMEARYSKNFILALYCLKSGTDLSHMAYQKVSSDAKLRMASGMRPDLSIGTKEEARLVRLKGQIDKLLQMMDHPPQKYAQVNEKLVKACGIYSDMNSLIVAPPASLDSYSDSSSRLESEFTQSFKELKANLPPDLSEKIRAAKSRFKNLQNI